MPEIERIVNGRWPQLAQAFARQNVLVVGDVMLDHTAAGQARRLSPEAPVPVLTVDDEWCGLGGAANVARNLAALGARVRLAGAVGADEAGETLRDLCDAAGIDTRALITAPERKTTVKTRFIAGTQQVLRVDSETPEPPTPAGDRELIGRLHDGAVDAVIVSDYAKGLLTDAVIAAAVRLARRCGAPCVVDPKGRGFQRYLGCTVITPNADEAAAAAGLPVQTEAESEAAGRALLQTAGCEAVVITRGRQGLSLVTHDGSWHLPAHARDVFDVTGAGDTLVAALTLSLAGGASLLEAAAVANVAAGIAVQARGVAVVERETLGRALAGAEPRSPEAARGEHRGE